VSPPLLFAGARGALRIVTTLQEFLLRGIPSVEELLAIAPDDAAFVGKCAELAALNDDFEEATTPGGNPEWFAMSSLMQLALAFEKDPTERRRELVTEALEKAKECVRPQT
jgi:hypothetical protein